MKGIDNVKKPLTAFDPILHQLPDLLYGESEEIEKMFKLLSEQVEHPFSLSINGSWGAGKTTLMKVFQKKFEDEGFPVLWFNPWEYERADDIVFCFLVELSRFAKSELKDVLKELGIFSLGTLLNALDATSRILTKNSVTSKNFIENFEKMDEAFKGRYQEENPVEIIKNDFAKLTQKIAQKYKGKPLIIFMDDLDRCLPDKAIELLESMKNFFVVPNAEVLFISGVDTQIAKQFIIKRYEGIDSSFAYSYFKKIFNFTFNVPTIKEPQYLKLISHRFNELFSASEQGSERIERWSQDLTSLIIQVHADSIRPVYQIIQNFYVHSCIKKDFQDTDNLLLRFFVLKEYWPDLFEKMVRLANADQNIQMNQLIKNFRVELKDTEFPISRVLGIFFNSLSEDRGYGSCAALLEI